jgi:hypothetical protein
LDIVSVTTSTSRPGYDYAATRSASTFAASAMDASRQEDWCFAID